MSAQLVAYNIPEARGTHLHLSAAVIGDIYANRIAYWDDAKIASLNASQHLPHQKIVPVRRSEGSGDTFMFTSYLSTAKSWPVAGPGTTIRWPQRPSMLEARGNDGMVSVAGKTPYSIAYIAISYLDQAQTAGLDFAALQSRDGSFVLPSRDTMSAAVNGAPMSGDGRVSLIARPGANAYPIVTYEYAIVREHQGDAKKAETLKNFLSWAINSNGGNSLERFLSDLNFVPLPTSARSVAMGLIDRIK